MDCNTRHNRKIQRKRKKGHLQVETGLVFKISATGKPISSQKQYIMET